MKEVVARATIKTDRFINTGFIHIKDDLIEGIFTLDYIKIVLDGKKIFLYYDERNIYEDDFGILHDEFLTMVYEKLYDYPYLCLPAIYSLCDGEGSVLNLSITSCIKETKLISQVLSDIEKIRI